MKRELSESEDSLSVIDESSEGSEIRIRTRAARKQSKPKAETRKTEQATKRLRDRGTRKNYAGMDSSEDDYMEEPESDNDKRKRSSRS